MSNQNIILVFSTILCLFGSILVIKSFLENRKNKNKDVVIKVNLTQKEYQDLKNRADKYNLSIANFFKFLSFENRRSN